MLKCNIFVSFLTKVVFWHWGSANKVALALFKISITLFHGVDFIQEADTLYNVENSSKQYHLKRNVKTLSWLKTGNWSLLYILGFLLPNLLVLFVLLLHLSYQALWCPLPLQEDPGIRGLRCVHRSSGTFSGWRTWSRHLPVCGLNSRPSYNQQWRSDCRRALVVK